MSAEAVVFVARNSNTGPASRLPFNSVFVNYGNRWDSNTKKFVMAAIRGLYFMSLGVGVEAGVPIKYSLMKNNSRVASITRTSTVHPGPDTVSRDLIVKLSAADSIHVSSGYAVRSTSFNYYTYLCLFSITDAMKDFPVAFSVARDGSTSGLLNPVPFNIELVNEGYHYNQNHIFTAPSDGIYYFSISVGLSAGRTANFTLYKNDEPLANILRLGTNHNGSDTISRSIMISLQRKDTVHVVNQENRVAWSSPELETSFSGFLYEPAYDHAVSFFIASLNFQLINVTLLLNDNVMLSNVHITYY